MESVADEPFAASDLSESERHIRLVLEATPNAMVMIDDTGRIVLVNSQTEALFGHDRATLLQMTVEDLIPERFRNRHRGYRSGFRARPSVRAMGVGRDLCGLRNDGTEIPIEIGLSPLETNEGNFVLASIIDITERKRSEERLVQVVEAAPNAMVMIDDSGQVVLVNSQTERSFGYSRDELLALRVEDLIPARFRSDHEVYRAGFARRPSRREMGAGRELFGRRKDGTEFPIEIGLNPISIKDERLVLTSIIDITERLVAQETENSLRANQLRKSILDSLPFSIIATDASGTIVTANPAAETLLGYTQRDLVGSSIHTVHGSLISDDFECQAPVTAALEATGHDGRESAYQRKDGSVVPVHEAVAPMLAPNGEPSGFLTVAYDATKRIEAQAAVRHMAHHDVLTDLPNRTMLFQHLDATISRSETERTRIAVLLLDLDHFKRVNDSLGHHVGDELLLRMSARLRQCVRADDLVARLGGDEFVIVFGDVDENDPLAPRIEQLMAAVSSPINVHGHELLVSASMGGATYPQDGADATALIKNADTAMYHAKTSGRNNFQWFFQALLDETNDKIALSSALRHALENDELSLAYQPLISLDTNEVIAIEALARWDSPHHGSVPPSRFIPVAEDSGMIGQLGEWVLRQACADGVATHAALGRPIRVAVNVSPRQFHNSDLLATVGRALTDSGLDPKHLELEITEGILMEDPNDVIDTLHALRNLGVGIVVDDFGTGFSSLAYLTRFPIDRIKIDSSFVRDLTVDSADAAIVNAIIAMAHTLGMQVVAEGVETAEQEAHLRARACDEAQGFRYNRAVPLERLVPIILGMSPAPVQLTVPGQR